VRQWALRAICAVAEGAHVLLDSASGAVTAALGDAQQRVAALGGRQGMPRSIGTLYGGLIVLFLGTDFRGTRTRVVAARLPAPWGETNRFHCIAVTRDGSTLLMLPPMSNYIYVYSVADGALLRVVGAGSGPLQFRLASDIFVAADDCVFITDQFNNRVQELTPALCFKGFVGVGHLDKPGCVCADAQHVFVSASPMGVHVFRRCDGAFSRFVRLFDSKPHFVRVLRVVNDSRQLAVVDYKHTLSLLTIDGVWARGGEVGWGDDVACSDYGEIVVVYNRLNFSCMCVYGPDGTRLRTFHFNKRLYAVTLSTSRVFVSSDDGECAMLE
jgi:hypothetical protein